MVDTSSLSETEREAVFERGAPVRECEQCGSKFVNLDDQPSMYYYRSDDSGGKMVSLCADCGSTS